MNLRKMQYFVDAVELENFSMVAKKNYISQTAISQQIMAIENEVGTQLFERLNTGVKVNAQGKLLYAFCCSTLKEYEKTVESIRSMVSGGKKTLLVAITQVGGQIVPDILTAFLKKYPDISVNVKCLAINEMAEQVKDGNVDFAIGPIYDFIDSDAVDTEILYSEATGIIVAKNSSLFKMPKITFGDLRHETVIMLPKGGGLKSREHLLEKFKENSYLPKKVIDVPDMKAQAVLVSANVGIAFVAENANIDAENNAFKLIDGFHDELDIVLAWRKDNTDKTVQNFLKCCLG